MNLQYTRFQRKYNIVFWIDLYSDNVSNTIDSDLPGGPHSLLEVFHVATWTWLNICHKLSCQTIEALAETIEPCSKWIFS